MVKGAQKFGFKLSELESIVKKNKSVDKFRYTEIIEAIEKKRQQILSEYLFPCGCKKLKNQTYEKQFMIRYLVELAAGRGGEDHAALQLSLRQMKEHK